MFLEDRRHRLLHNTGIRATATNSKQQSNRNDQSPPHSATGRLTMSSPSQQLLKQ